MLMHQTASYSNVKSTLAQTKPLTNRSNNEENNSVQLRNLYENQLMREPRIFHRTSGNIFYHKVRSLWSLL